MKRRSWTLEQLKAATQTSRSYRQVLQKLGLREAGGNYKQVQKYIKEAKLNTSHFTGRLWSKGQTGLHRKATPLEYILKRDSSFQSYKLKRRLFKEGLKQPVCELCQWAQKSVDGRIPLELDHINGDHTDNRLLNLRVLCPNCHSLQPTHRGLNRRKKS